MRTRQVCKTQQGGGTITNIANFEDLANIPQRMAIMLGVFDEWYMARKGSIPRRDGNRSQFSQVKYKFLLDAPFEVSNKCCNVMKKSPAHKYSRQTGKKPITAQMASESRLRTQKWLQNGCNAFDAKEPVSNPMAFWTEQDVLLYIKSKNLPLCSVYGEIVVDNTDNDNYLDGQLTFADIEEWKGCGIFDMERPLLKTTGCTRTGCMFCGFGCHLNQDDRYTSMKKTHPAIYDYVFKPESEGGLGYKEKIDWLNENGKLKIKY